MILLFLVRRGWVLFVGGGVMVGGVEFVFELAFLSRV